ncbi:alpha/beta fold hydrolase [Aurantibacter crassamenti]|uniref:alpha/beta fold hydrolase n=1 Tax=Aurantibacter crassamenti TaxID=1837375 RepID=UPI0019397076|nr:alpha/beta fold hydrolase [Aurantibacter crassamenti]MBM1106061.1 alpha/beta fold hydrolase [Aurantibacter crassamenti]
MEILHSKIIGEGKPLIILHGFLGMSDNWKTLGSKYAEEGFQVHLVDQRNHGKSFWSDEFNYEILAADIVDYMTHHQIEKAYIIGHSMGGKTAMQLACVNSERVEKLIVADIAPKFYPPHHQNIIDALNQLNLSAIDSRSQAEAELEKHLSEYGVRQFLLKNLYWVEKVKLGWRFNLKVLSNRMEEVGENIESGSIFEGPTLFLKGERSEYVIASDETVIKNHFPKATIETIAKAGHWLHAENPSEFFTKSLSFLKA